MSSSDTSSISSFEIDPLPLFGNDNNKSIDFDINHFSRQSSSSNSLANQLQRLATESTYKSRPNKASNSNSSSSSSVSSSSGTNGNRYKTELCRPFQEKGACKYGEKCQFAHGKQELRAVNRHPKYKTDLCRTYHTVGFCPYGPRCHFIHNLEEAKSKPLPNCSDIMQPLPMFNNASLGLLDLQHLDSSGYSTSSESSQSNSVADFDSDSEQTMARLPVFSMLSK